MERIALLYDVHAPYHDKNAYAIAIDYIKNLKPKVTRIILAGDFADFYQVSFWKSDPKFIIKNNSPYGEIFFAYFKRTSVEN